ncbi:Protein PSP1 [Cyberlindnera fabianii]|uniref:Protein PSP1 n=1 Tax=Cyberlindnera fabianii TaxID=36022 RepID=A0A1V2KYZ1_CYBFA|nr:Protein PSP1 [Cyberlindnera fabianii]
MFNFENRQRPPNLSDKSQSYPDQHQLDMHQTDLTAITTPSADSSVERSILDSSDDKQHVDWAINMLPEQGPFELNQSIWSSPPGSAQSSVSAPLGVAGQSINTTRTYSQQYPSQTFNFMGARRASAIEPYQLQQMQAQMQQQQQQQQGFPQYINTAPLSNNNYMLWSQNNAFNDLSASDYMMWQQQQQHQQQHQHARNSAPETGFFNMNNRRHNSLDDTFSQTHIPEQSNDMSTTTNNHHHQSPHFNENMFDSQGSIVETTQVLLDAYASVDHYFTHDPCNRATITQETMDHLTSVFEEMVNTGVQLPRFSSSQLPSTKLILIAFKAGRVDVFHLPESTHLILKIGDLVVVEADRGRDLGKVLKLDVTIDEARLLKYMQHQEQQAALASFEASGSTVATSSSGGNNNNNNNNTTNNNNNNNNPPTLHFPKPILRFAMPNEVYQLTNKQSDEEKARKICSLKIEASGLKMRVVDAEYQWDRRKLTFYYNAMHRIDFRELVRELFRIYKTRIWMCAVTSDAIELPDGQITPLGSSSNPGNLPLSPSTSASIHGTIHASNVNWYSPSHHSHQQSSTQPWGATKTLAAEDDKKEDISLLVPRQFQLS